MKMKFSLLFLVLLLTHFSNAQGGKRALLKKNKEVSYLVEPSEVEIQIQHDDRRFILSTPQDTIDSYFEYFNVLRHEGQEIMVYYGLLYTLSIHENWVTINPKYGENLVWYFSSPFPAEAYKLDEHHPNHLMNEGAR